MNDPTPAPSRVTNSSIPAAFSASLTKDVIPMMNHTAEQADALIQRGADAVRSTTQHLRDSAIHANDVAAEYVRKEPMKALLIAAAAGAALVTLVGLISRARSRD
jgi:ElaB/YqjD/DUF883 family membrane-anchored ribosome-binding protein